MSSLRVAILPLLCFFVIEKIIQMNPRTWVVPGVFTYEKAGLDAYGELNVDYIN